MVNENKKSMFAAVAGVVVGAGAVIAGAVALSDKNNQKKVREALAKGKKMVKEYVNKANEQADEAGELVEDKIAGGKQAVKTVANKVIKSAEKATKAAKQEVRKI
jgi:gas vesicle protein